MITIKFNKSVDDLKPLYDKREILARECQVVLMEVPKLSSFGWYDPHRTITAWWSDGDDFYDLVGHVAAMDKSIPGVKVCGIGGMVVRYDWRGFGIGLSLLRALEFYAFQVDYNAILGFAADDAVGFYQNHNYLSKQMPDGGNAICKLVRPLKDPASVGAEVILSSVDDVFPERF